MENLPEEIRGTRYEDGHKVMERTAALSKPADGHSALVHSTCIVAQPGTGEGPATVRREPGHRPAHVDGCCDRRKTAAKGQETCLDAKSRQMTRNIG